MHGFPWQFHIRGFAIADVPLLAYPYLCSTGSVEGSDIAAMMDEVSEAHFYLTTARNVVGNYREFCKRVRTFVGLGTAKVCTQ